MRIDAYQGKLRPTKENLERAVQFVLGPHPRMSKDFRIMLAAHIYKILGTRKGIPEIFDISKSALNSGIRVLRNGTKYTQDSVADPIALAIFCGEILFRSTNEGMPQ